MLRTDPSKQSCRDGSQSALCWPAIGGHFRTANRIPGLTSVSVSITRPLSTALLSMCTRQTGPGSSARSAASWSGTGSTSDSYGSQRMPSRRLIPSTCSMKTAANSRRSGTARWWRTWQRQRWLTQRQTQAECPDRGSAAPGVPSSAAVGRRAGTRRRQAACPRGCAARDEWSTSPCQLSTWSRPR